MHFFILLNFLLLTHSLKGIAPIIHLLIELYNSFKICYSRLLFLEFRSMNLCLSLYSWKKTLSK